MDLPTLLARGGYMMAIRVPIIPWLTSLTILLRFLDLGITLSPTVNESGHWILFEGLNIMSVTHVNYRNR